MLSSFSFPYHGGFYRGNIKLVKMKPRRGKMKGKTRLCKIPHGLGVYTYDGMRFDGMFRDGFEEEGTLIWPDGSSFVGKFNGGYPEPKILLNYNENSMLKRRVKKLQSNLALAEAELLEYKEDLDIEKETTMAVALTLDRCQAKLQRLMEIASEMTELV
jgi:hypothetical protein